MTEDEDWARWRNVHRLLVKWIEEDDELAGEMILDWLHDGVIMFEVTDKGALLKPGPEWPSTS